ncbi:MAG: histone deacetylase [Candidatus Aenigmatarchaeota archaeon]
MKIVFSPKCLEYDSPGHPENSDRVRKTYEFLKDKNFSFVRPEPCERKDLLLVHSKELVDSIKKGSFEDFETPALPNIYNYAKLAVGSAIKSMEIALKEGKAFSLMRPPGHHAGKRKLEGFCYFNNIAVAVAKALKKVDKVAIIDIDVHHGNGTQEIFLGEERVVFVSLHQFGFGFYPGTGKHSEANCYNFPLESGTDETIYLQKLEIALEIVKKFDPDLIAISAGFDTYKDDPLGGLNLEIESYTKIAKMIAELKKPTFAVLEGGYSGKLAECVYAFLKIFYK